MRHIPSLWAAIVLSCIAALPGAGTAEPLVSSLHLYLAEGFANDHVVVEVDGRKVLDADGVTTKKLTGLAMQIAPVAVQGQRSRVGVRLPRKGLDAAFEVDLGKGSHVPISIENGQLSHSVHRQIGFM